MNDKTCWCVVYYASSVGDPPAKVFISKARADEYADQLNDAVKRSYRPYTVKECTFDETLSEVRK